MTTPRESEIKLDLDEAGANALRGRLVERFGPGTTEPLHSVYFDTAGRDLHDHLVTLRIRGRGDGRVQTVKAGGGLFERAEWESPIDGGAPDLQAARDTPVHDILRRRPGVLQPVFETKVRRTSWTVPRAGSLVEIALDEGEVRAPGRAEPLLELELELKHGQPADAFALLREIDPDAALPIGVRSKSERGYALLRRKPKEAYKAEPVPLKPGMSTDAAFAVIIGSCIRQIRLNELLMTRTRGSEALHQLRVGMRRLRSALSLFKEVVADAEADRLRARLGAVSRVLGEARDLDVYLETSAAPEAARNVDEPGATAYLASITTRREAAFDRVLAVLAGPDHRRLMMDLLAWIEAGPWRVSDDPLRRAMRERPIESVAAGILERRRRGLKKKGRDLDQLDPDARHQARIAAKKLRYAAEFVAGVAAGRKKDRERHAGFVAALESLQTALGALNDIRAGHELALRFANGVESEGSPDALFAAGHISGRQDEREEALLAEAVTGYQAVMGAKRFWRRWS